VSAADGIAELPRPFMVGEVIPGYCGGQFPGTWYDDDLRVEAVGVDWIVLRTDSGGLQFYAGDHAALRRDVEIALRDRERAG